MAIDIGAAGFVGVAPEVTAGTYVAPTKFFPIRSEGLQFNNNTQWRRVIRGTADVIGAVNGDGGVEGDLEMELLSGPLVHMLRAARGTITKSGTAAPFTYTFKPSHSAVPPKTLSVTVVRSGVAFGYTGVVIGGMSFGVDNGQAVVTFNLLGRNEQSVALPASPVYSDTGPFGAGTWYVEIPTATQVFDTDNLTLEINDNGSLQNRLKNTLGAQFVAYGERETTLSVERDFDGRAEYDQFKAVTAKSIQVRVEKAADNLVEFLAPVSIIDSYEVSLGGVGDLVRASVSYMAAHDATVGGSYQIRVMSTEDITI